MNVTPTSTHILTVNAGSSSIRLAVFTAGATPRKVSEVVIAGIGQPQPTLTSTGTSQTITAPDHTAAAAQLVRWLESDGTHKTAVAVGHRIVHGGPYYHKSQLITDHLIADLKQLTAFDPHHLPAELHLIQTFRQLLPTAQHIACFDTAFHHDLPTRARLLPVPRHLEAQGIRRYGFHGLSYTYVLEELRRVEGEAAANGKVIIAHLGSGASLAAIQGGVSVDTTMSMTPTSGIPMSTRSGDLDPSLALYLAQTQGYDAEQFNHMATFESGLLGMSETSADMEQLLRIQATDPRAHDAISVFCYNVTKSIGSLAAALGGLNTLVFTGGMGEHAPVIRARVCDNLAFMGMYLDPARNQASERLVSTDDSSIGVHVIRTDEATTIARETIQLINRQISPEGSA